VGAPPASCVNAPSYTPASLSALPTIIVIFWRRDESAFGARCCSTCQGRALAHASSFGSLTWRQSQRHLQAERWAWRVCQYAKKARMTPNIFRNHSNLPSSHFIARTNTTCTCKAPHRLRLAPPHSQPLHRQQRRGSLRMMSNTAGNGMYAIWKGEAGIASRLVVNRSQCHTEACYRLRGRRSNTSAGSRGEEACG
jgi:hypothetical protein